MPRTASAQATEKSLLLSLTKADFHNFLLVAPDLKIAFEQVCKERTTNLMKKFNVPFFAAIPEEKFHQLASLCEIEEYPSNKVIFSQNDKGNAFYLIAYGSVDVIIEKKESGQKVKVTTIGPGKYFGEIALVTDSPRTATIVTSSRTILLSITKEKFEQFFSENPEAYADFAIKLSREDVPLESVLSHPTGFKHFAKFLQTEFSIENLNFYEASRKYAKISSDADRRIAGTEIYNKYVDQNAPEQVNIPSDMREPITISVKKQEFPADLFDSALKEITKLMAKDSFRRFKNDNLFQLLLESIGSYSKIPDATDVN